MSEGSGNVDASQQDPLKGTKWEGKSAAEIAAAHAELETRLGTQGKELGDLRQLVRSMVQEKATKPAGDSQPYEQARKDEYVRMGDDLITKPEEVLPRLAKKIREEAREEALSAVRQEVTTRDSLRGQTEEFFRSNPGLNRYREVVSAIGDLVYRSNPTMNYSEVLAETKKQAETYLVDLKRRISEDSADERKRKSAAVTTSGGTAREGVPGAEEQPEEEGIVDENRAAIEAEIARLKDFRAPRMNPRAPLPKK